MHDVLRWFGPSISTSLYLIVKISPGRFAGKCIPEHPQGSGVLMVKKPAELPPQALINYCYFTFPFRSSRLPPRARMKFATWFGGIIRVPE